MRADARGAKRWLKPLPGRGYIQLVADGDVHAWTGELDAKGKAIRDEVGAVLPDHGASFE